MREPNSSTKNLLRWTALIGSVIAAAVGGAAEPAADVVINARVFNGYARTKLADGSFKPERFAVAEGTRWKGKQIDPSLDGLSLPQIARTIAGPLRAQGYIPSSDPKRTDLLILVSWGVTTGAEDGQYSHAIDGFSAAANALPATESGLEMSAADDTFNTWMMMQELETHMREQNNRTNAGILGYGDAYDRAREMRRIGFAAGDTPIWELEANRYFVVLKAYDFRVALQEKKLTLLWEARFSIYERGNRFDEQLLPMTRVASKYFGQDTAGLVRREVPEGKVEVGTPQVVEGHPGPDTRR